MKRFLVLLAVSVVGGTACWEYVRNTAIRSRHGTVDLHCATGQLRELFGVSADIGVDKTEVLYFYWRGAYWRLGNVSTGGEAYWYLRASVAKGMPVSDDQVCALAVEATRLMNGIIAGCDAADAALPPTCLTSTSEWGTCDPCH